jgi:diguanylate cyclase (GGDEF)-like protein/PAS domain S-box-containing protein
VILAARPFTGSPRRALITAAVAAGEYALLAWYFVGSGKLTLLVNPMFTSSSAGTSILDEAAKTMLLIAAGGVATYATAWNERTLARSAEAMRTSEARFRTVFEHAAVGIALLDDDSRIVDTNPAFSRLVGYSASELRGRQPHDLSPAEDAEAARGMLAEVAADGHSSAAEVRYVRKDGHVTWGSVTLSRAHGTRDLRLIAMVQDVSHRKALEAELLHQAFHDPLTNLANRSLFRDRVEHSLARASRAPSHIAVLFLDLDNFKSVNDTLGHATGDRLLSCVAGRLLNATRGCDTVARLGGDEFGVLLEHVQTLADAEIVAQRITESLRTPIDVGGGRTMTVTTSIGIARAEPGHGSEELLRNADVAMYAAKGRARGTWVMFDPAMHKALVDRVTMENDLGNAITSGQLIIAYQPIVDLDGGAIQGVEALVRWNHPDRGLVAPAQFIPMAEETGLIVPLGRFVLNAACRQGARWNASRVANPLTVTVNLSGRQLADADLVRDVTHALNESGFEPRCLVLEITESVLMQDTQAALERLKALKSLGVRLAIDDFGTGYSSLSHLQQFPIDVLKIDRSFTEGIPHDANSSALARTIITLGGMLTLRTIAEGVETQAQHDSLRELGCTMGQGFLFSRPVSAAMIDHLLQEVLLEETAWQG